MGNRCCRGRGGTYCEWLVFEIKYFTDVAIKIAVSKIRSGTIILETKINFVYCCRFPILLFTILSSVNVSP